MDIFRAAIWARMLTREYEQGGFTFGSILHSKAVPPSWKMVFSMETSGMSVLSFMTRYAEIIAIIQRVQD